VREPGDTAWCDHPRWCWVEADTRTWCPMCSIVEHLHRIPVSSTWHLARAMGLKRPVVRGYLRFLEKTRVVEQVDIVTFADAPTEGIARWRLTRR
jgi:hypothetical protein